jgi:putative ABC transport system permease protein
MVRKRSDADFRAEIEAHVELEAARLCEQGMSEDDARSAARRAFGSLTAAQERFYERNRWLWLDSVRQDLRLGIRLLAKTPSWTVVLVLTAALGIGASVAMFSVVYATWLKPLPYGNPHELYWINQSHKNTSTSPPTSGTRDSATYGWHLQVRESTTVFSHVAAFDVVSATLPSGDGSRPVKAASVTTPFFAALGVQPLYGRTFRPEEEGVEAAVVILSDSFWQRTFDGDPDIIGKSIALHHGRSRSATVVGIMPPSFDFPSHRGRQVIDDEWIPEIWLPWPRRSPRQVARIVARARPDASAEQVAAEMDRISQVMRSEMTEEQRVSTGVEYFARPLREQLVGRSRQPLLIFGGAVVLMLLIACFNIATLLLSRATSRWRETAVRVALGAPRSRIVRQMLAESLLIAAAGGALGLGLAAAALRAFNASREPLALGLPPIAIDTWTAAFTAGLVIVTGLAFGVAPAFSVAGFQARDALTKDTRTATGTRGIRRLRQALVVGQLTFSLTLLIGAGLLARTYLQIWSTDPGIDTDNVITVGTGARFQGVIEELQEVVRQLRAIPGVEQVALTSASPGTDEGGGGTFEIEGRPGQRERAQHIRVSPEYFDLLRVPLRQGRFFVAADLTQIPHPVVVNESFARRFFGSENPVGRRLTLLPVFPADPPTPLTISGVAGDVRQHELEREPEPMVYRQVDGAFATPVMRAGVDPRILIPEIRQTLSRANPNQPPPDVKVLNDAFADALSPRRFNAALIGGFAVTAALLAVIGVYGVMNYLVTLRTREMGIRQALGARRQTIIRLVVREGLGLGLTGAIFGIAGALALSRFLESMLLNVAPWDPAVFIAGTAALLVVVASSCLVPGYRASRADPAVVLRQE